MFIAINFGKFGFGGQWNPVEKTLRLGIVAFSIFRYSTWALMGGVAQSAVEQYRSMMGGGCHGCSSQTPQQEPQQQGEELPN